MTSDGFPVYVKIGQFSREFGFGRSKIYDLIGEGHLRVKKSGESTLIETASGVEYMNKVVACIFDLAEQLLFGLNAASVAALVMQQITEDLRTRGSLEALRDQLSYLLDKADRIQARTKADCTG